MRLFNCIGIGHKFIHENGKKKAFKNLIERLFFDGKGIVTSTKSLGFFRSRQTWLKLTMTRPNMLKSQSANVYWPSDVKSIVQFILNANHLLIWFKDSLLL